MSFLLLVEDCPRRESWFRAELPDGAPRLVCCPNGGRALGLLRRNAGQGLSGILLDHDLTQRFDRISGRPATGMDVAHLIVRTVSRDVPVLVHSSNRTHGPAMAQLLRGAGFDVTRIAFPSLTRQDFREWVLDSVECS